MSVFLKSDLDITYISQEYSDNFEKVTKGLASAIDHPELKPSKKFLEKCFDLLLEMDSAIFEAESIINKQREKLSEFDCLEVDDDEEDSDLWDDDEEDFEESDFDIDDEDEE